MGSTMTKHNFTVPAFKGSKQKKCSICGMLELMVNIESYNPDGIPTCEQWTLRRAQLRLKQEAQNGSKVSR